MIEEMALNENTLGRTAELSMLSKILLNDNIDYKERLKAL
jgi:hypothetical protein